MTVQIIDTNKKKILSINKTNTGWVDISFIWETLAYVKQKHSLLRVQFSGF